MTCCIIQAELGRGTKCVSPTTEIEAEQRKAGCADDPAWREQEWQRDQSGERIFGQDVTVPQQRQVEQANGEQDQQAPQQQDRTAVRRDPVELHRQTDAEQK